MNDFIINVMNNWGYTGILLLIMIENLFPPIPSEVILTLAGFLTLESKMTILGVIVMSTIGSLLGAIILYLLGRLLNIDVLIKIASGKVGKALRFKVEDIKYADKWFIDKGYKTVFFCRCIPIVRSLISIPAGIAKMSFVKFLTYTLFGSLIWNTTLVFIGTYAGEKKDILLHYFDSTTEILLLIIMLLTIIGIIKYFKNKKKIF